MTAPFHGSLHRRWRHEWLWQDVGHVFVVVEGQLVQQEVVVILVLLVVGVIGMVQIPPGRGWGSRGGRGREFDVGVIPHVNWVIVRLTQGQEENVGAKLDGLFDCLSNGFKTNHLRSKSSYFVSNGKPVILITLISDIQMGAVCCFSMRSVSFEYHWPSVVTLVRLRVPVYTWVQSFSSFWHCSSNFLDERWAFLKDKEIVLSEVVRSLTMWQIRLNTIEMRPSDSILS